MEEAFSAAILMELVQTEITSNAKIVFFTILLSSKLNIFCIVCPEVNMPPGWEGKPPMPHYDRVKQCIELVAMHENAEIISEWYWNSGYRLWWDSFDLI